MPTPTSALADFRRFPAWMWRNSDVVRFVEWLRARNDAHADPATKARFYGLDLYSLRASMEAVVALPRDASIPTRPGDARERYSCFDHVGGEGQAYGYGRAVRWRQCPARTRSSRSWSTCDAAPMRILRRDGWVAEDEYFFAEQNAESCATPRSTTSRCTEPRSRRGTCATATWRPRSTHSSTHLDRQFGRAEGRGVGAQLPRRGCTGDRRWVRRGELNVGQLVRDSARAATVFSSASPRRRHG